MQQKKSPCDEPVAPGRDRAFKPSGEEKWKRSKNLEAEKPENVLYAMLPKHVRLRKLMKSAWSLHRRLVLCPLLMVLLVSLVLNFAAPFVTVHLPEQFQGILFLHMMNYNTQHIQASTGTLAAMMMGNRWLHIKNRPCLGTPARRVAS